jgi:signal transduction histidine kinase
MSTVMIVDDEKSIRVSLGLFLKNAGYAVIEAADAKDANQWAATHPLDIALIDVRLGKDYGIDVARHLRERQPDVKTILMTGEPNFASASDAIRLRIFDYLVKPIEKKQLLEVVGQAAAVRARENEYAALLRERERTQEYLERQVHLRTAELNQSTANLRALATHMQVVREEERTALARELHDEFGQNLTAIQIDLDWLDRHLRTVHPPDIALLQDKIAGMTPLTEHLTELTQSVCASLRPAMLDDLGLLAAIEWQVEDCQQRTGLTGSLSLPTDDLVLDPGRALALFRILQEALTNVVRHAQATRVEVSLHLADHSLLLDVQDNGRGFAPESFPTSKSLGLLSMRERAGAFGGTVNVLSEPGLGTTVQVRMLLA